MSKATCTSPLSEFVAVSFRSTNSNIHIYVKGQSARSKNRTIQYLCNYILYATIVKHFDRAGQLNMNFVNNKKGANSCFRHFYSVV